MANDTEIGKLIIRITAELADLKKMVGEANSIVKDHSDKTKGTLGSLKATWLEFTAGIYAAYRSVTKAMDWAELGAKAKQAEESFKAITASIGVNGEKLISELKQTGYVFVDQTELMLKAQRLLVEGMAPDQVVNLMEAARVAARLMGVDVSEAFERISEAIIALRTRGLAAAFPTLRDQEEIFKKHAEALGTIPKYLSLSEQRLAIYNEVVRATADRTKLLSGGLKSLGDVTDSEKVQAFKSAWSEAKELLGKGVLEVVMATAEALGYLIAPIEIIIKLFEKAADAKEKVGKPIHPVTGSDLLQLNPQEISTGPGLAPSHGTGIESFLSGHGKRGAATDQAAEDAKAQKKGQDQSKKLTDDFEKDVQRLILDYSKKTADQLVEIQKSRSEIEKNEAIRAASERGESTEQIERDYAIRAFSDRLEVETTAIERGRQVALTEAKEKGLLTKDVERQINEQFDKERLKSASQIEAEITAIWKTEAENRTKALQEALQVKLSLTDFMPGPDEWEVNAKKILGDIDKIRTDLAVSGKDMELAQLQDLYERGGVLVYDYYGKRKNLLQESSKLQTDQLQKESELALEAGDTVTSEQKKAEIIQKINELTKSLLDLDREKIASYDQEIQRLMRISEIERQRQEAAIDRQRMELRISEGEAIQGKIGLQEQYLKDLDIEMADLRETRALNGGLTKEQQVRFAQLQTLSEQAYGKLAELQQRAAEQSGDFFEGMARGWKEVADEMKSGYELGRDLVKGISSDTRSFFSEIVTSGKVSMDDLTKFLRNIWGRTMNALLDNWINTVVKNMSSGGTSGGGWFGSLLKMFTSSGTSVGGQTVTGGDYGWGGLLQNFDSGGDIPKTGPIFAHEREKVISRAGLERIGSEFVDGFNRGKGRGQGMSGSKIDLGLQIAHDENTIVRVVQQMITPEWVDLTMATQIGKVGGHTYRVLKAGL